MGVSPRGNSSLVEGNEMLERRTLRFEVVNASKSALQRLFKARSPGPKRGCIYREVVGSATDVADRGG